MTRSLGLLAIVAALATSSILACGSSIAPTSPLDGGTSDGSSVPDGNPGDGSLGDGGTSTCAPSNGTATFHLTVLGDAPFCDGTDCDSSFLTIRRQDGTSLPINSGCMRSCADCKPIACTGACRAPATIGAAGLTAEWRGTVYATSTCGQATQCASSSCVEAGTYVAHMCGYLATTDAGASSICQSAATTPTCTDVTFTWPPTGVISGTIGGATR